MQVSVIIPTYNRVHDLNKCLTSIIIQTTLPKEVIIVDDSDNDEIENLIEQRKDEFKEKDILLRYIRNEKEKSSAIARNIGIENARGNIFLFLDDDVILDKGYIKEILKVYEKYPNALGVQGYITNVKVSKIMNFINKIFFLGCLEKDKCRLLPSTENTYPSNLTKIIKAQMTTGSNISLKRNLLHKIRFDEKLVKYSYKEDKHLACSITKKYPDSLFMTPHARLIHNVSQVGRLPKKQRSSIQEIYTLYFFYKNIDQTLKNKLIFLWSRTGYLVLNLSALMLKPAKSRWLRLKYLIDAYIRCIKHIKEIKAGNLEFLNKELRR